MNERGDFSVKLAQIISDEVLVKRKFWAGYRS